MKISKDALVAQLDKALPSEDRGQRFESSRVRQLSVFRSVDRGSSDFFQTINVLEQELVTPWCGYGYRYAFTKEMKLVTSPNQSHLIFNITVTSGRLK